VTRRDSKAGSAIRAISSWALSLCLCAAILYHLRNEHEKFLQLLSIRPGQLILLSSLCAALFLPAGLSRKLMAKRLNIRLTFLDWYGLLMVTNLLGLFVPARGDLAMSALYLRRRYGLPVIHFISMVYGSAILLAFCLSLTGALCLLVFAAGGVSPNFSVIGIIAAVGFLSLLLGWLQPSLLRGESWFVSRLRAALEGWERLRSDSRLLVQLTLLSLSGIALFALWMFASYRALGFEVRFLPSTLAGVVVLLSFFVSITPGNLGIREILLGFTSEVLGLGFAEGVAVTLLQRAVSILVFLCLGGFFSLFIMQALTQSLQSQRREESQP
jgi:uncharacterized membrane protein YbhN (UPF0104 family)